MSDCRDPIGCSRDSFCSCEKPPAKVYEAQNKEALTSMAWDLLDKICELHNFAGQMTGEVQPYASKVFTFSGRKIRMTLSLEPPQ